MAARMVTVVLKNGSNVPLTQVSASLSHGIWDVQVPHLVRAYTLVAWTSASNGFLTGTQGVASFYVGSDPSSVADFSWDIPYWGANSFNATAPAPYSVSQQGGVGQAAVVVFTFGP